MYCHPFLCGCWRARITLALMFLKQAFYQSVLKYFLAWKVAVMTWLSDRLPPENERCAVLFMETGIFVNSDTNLVLCCTIWEFRDLKTCLCHSETKAPEFLKSLLMKLVALSKNMFLGHCTVTCVGDSCRICAYFPNNWYMMSWSHKREKDPFKGQDRPRLHNVLQCVLRFHTLLTSKVPALITLSCP